MKYKNKETQKIKNKYGVSDLYFYLGYRELIYEDLKFAVGDYFIICSTYRKIKKVYKNRTDIRPLRRLTHNEVEDILEVLATGLPKMMEFHESRINIRKVLFEYLDTEFETLNSLRQAYLISYLSGISPVS